MVVKIVELAQPMSLMYSFTSVIEYLPVFVFSLSPQKSWTMLSPPPPLFRITEDRGVVGGLRSSDHTKSEPFLKGLFHKCLMIGFERELFLVDRLIIFEVESMFVGLFWTHLSLFGTCAEVEGIVF